MATKKQKRAAAQAKRAEFMAKVEADGLANLKKSQEWEKARKEQAASDAKAINDRHRDILARHGIQKPDAGFPQDTDQDYIDRAKRFAEAFEFGRVSE